MDFGVGFLSNNVMLPILDFFYSIVPSYGLAIIFLTLVIRLALYPLNVGQIRNMKKMKVVNPIIQRRMREFQERYADDPQKLREAQAEMYQELGFNPLGGCLPLLLQMPIIIALFSTLRGSPFALTTFDFNVQILPSEVAAEVVPAPSSTAAKNVFLTDAHHVPVTMVSPIGDKVGVGNRFHLDFQGNQGRPLEQLVQDAGGEPSALTPRWTITSGEDRVQVEPDGTVLPLQPGDVTIQGSLPGIAAETGFLFIDQLGAVGIRNDDGSINWDILGMIVLFGVSVYANTAFTQGGDETSNQDPSQSSLNKITPFMITGMFLFFPLPAGVLLYMLISNAFQTAQTYFLSREPLPEDLQAIVEQERRVQPAVVDVKSEPADSSEVSRTKKPTNRESLPFEPYASKHWVLAQRWF